MIKLDKPKQDNQLHRLAEIDAIFASIGEGLIVTNDIGKVTRVNKIALDIFGIKKSEIINKRFTDSIIAYYENGLPVSVIDTPIVKAFLTGKVINQKTIYKKKDGTKIPVQTTISPLMLRGKPIGSVQLFRDISSEIQMDKMKSDFISVASHQLRTPLSSVNIYAGMLKEGLAGEINDQQRIFIGTILTSVRRMNELIDTLLNITKIEAGGIKVSPEKTNLNNLLQEIISEIIPSTDNKKLKLTMDVDNDLKDIKTDGLLVKEVILNLLTNAIKYTPEKGSITISLKSDSNNVIFSIKDTGYGIPDHLQEHIFTKFFRADNILVHDVSGTGLGLYLTKVITDNLNGDLWFESIENKGSTFYLSLPIHGSIAKTGNYNIGS